MIRLIIYRVRMVPPIPQTIIVTPNVKLSMALPSFKKPWFNTVLDFLDPSTPLKPRSPVLRSSATAEGGEDRGKKSCPSISLGAVRLSNGSGSTLSMPLAKARGSRRVDSTK